jgi:hypothetical protein
MCDLLKSVIGLGLFSIHLDEILWQIKPEIYKPVIILKATSTAAMLLDVMFISIITPHLQRTNLCPAKKPS